MFTVCPKCTLTLAVTANDLRMGQGYVRCGRCANVFNALLTLSEEPVEDSLGDSPFAPAADAPASADETSADEASADEAADTTATDELVAPTAATASDVEPADGPVNHLATESSSDGSIENESNFAEGTGTFETIVLEGDGITQTEEYVPESSVDSEIAALTQRLGLAAHEAPATPPPQSDSIADELFAPPAPPVALTHATRWPWIAGSVLLLLLLAMQGVNHWRDALAASSAWYPALSRTYAALGWPLDPHWDLAAYDVRQQGAVTDPGDNQVIRVRVSLANRADRAQPLPLLRLTLLDRYGKRVAASELTPAQYWPTGTPPRALLARDERVDSEIAVRDPGAASASFELDVCLRSSAGALRCASDAATSP